MENDHQMTDFSQKSRQKSCHSCVQGKRRCDRQLPICSRCATKQIPCTYAQPRIHVPNDSAMNESLLRSFDPDWEPEMISPTCLDNMSQPFPPCFFDAVLDDGFAMEPARLNQAALLQRPNSPIDEEIARSYEKMAIVCKDPEPWHLYDTKTPLNAIVSRVKALVTDMATENSTPFLHRHLYRESTPRCILSCFTTCLLYANRTEGNKTMVMRALQSSVRELLDSETGRGSLVVVSPRESLARTQTLFLYQVIRLLDGDVMLRAQGERDIPLLKLWLADLQLLRDNLGNLTVLGDTASRQQTPMIEWEAWILAESVRRTIFIAHSFLTLYDMLRDFEGTDPQSPSPWSSIHRWTLSRHLWEANSPSEFLRAWQEKPQFIVANYSLARFLEAGRAGDVDRFAEMVLCVYMGVDELRDFLATDGSMD